MSLTDQLAAVEAAHEMRWQLFIDVCNAVLPPMQTNEDVAFKGRLVELVGVQAWETAALALCERVLPGGIWRVGTCNRTSDAEATVWPDGITAYMAQAATPALAVVTALLKAKLSLSAQDTSDGQGGSA